MPTAKRPCAQPGCGEQVTFRGRCDEHAAKLEEQRGNFRQRGYTTDHDRARARWAKVIERQSVQCARCGKPITRGDKWALDHSDDRTVYLGPSHEYCNAAAGAIASNHKRRD